MLHGLIRQVFNQCHLQLVTRGYFLHHFPDSGLVPRFFTAGIQRFPKISTSRPDSQAIRCASVFNLVHCECPFREKRLPLPAQRQRDDRTTARQHDFSVGVVQLQIKLVRFKAPVIRQRKPHQAVVQHSGDILAFNTDAECGSFVAFVKQFRAEIHDSSPPTVLLISLKADVAVSCKLFSCALRSPNISDRDSSTRLSDRVNSIRRGIPSRKNSVLV